MGAYPVLTKNRCVRGMTLVEVLIAMALFATVGTGLILAMQGLIRTNIEAVDRQLEATLMEIKLAEIDPNDATIESAYDVTTKTVQTLPNGREFYFTRDVRSDASTPDLKEVGVYLFRESTSSSPYRRFRREISPRALHYNLGSTSYYKDGLNQVWFPTPATGASAQSTDPRRNGFDTSLITAALVNQAVTLSGTPGPNTVPFQTVLRSTGPIAMKLMARTGGTYQLRLGFVHYTGGMDNAEVTVNGSALDSFTITSVAGGSGIPMIKTYTVNTMDDSGVPVVQVMVDSSDGTKTLASVSLERLAQ